MGDAARMPCRSRGKTWTRSSPSTRPSRAGRGAPTSSGGSPPRCGRRSSMRSSPRPMPPGSPATSSPACWKANSGAPSPACGWRSSACAGTSAPRHRHAAARRARDVGAAARHPRPAHAGRLERSRHAALARRDAFHAGAQPHRRLRRGRRPVPAGARRPGDDPRGRRPGARNRLRRAIRQPFRAAGARPRRRARDEPRPISPKSPASTARSPVAIARRTCRPGSTRRWSTRRSASR